MAYTPNPNLPLPSLPQVKKEWKKAQKFDRMTEGLTLKDDSAEIEFAEQEAKKCRNEISKAATAFLKAYGYNGGGATKRKIPGM